MTPRASGGPIPLAQASRVKAVRFFFDGRILDGRIGDLALGRAITPGTGTPR